MPKISVSELRNPLKLEHIVDFFFQKFFHHILRMHINDNQRVDGYLLHFCQRFLHQVHKIIQLRLKGRKVRPYRKPFSDTSHGLFYLFRPVHLRTIQHDLSRVVSAPLDSRLNCVQSHANGGILQVLYS